MTIANLSGELLKRVQSMQATQQPNEPPVAQEQSDAGPNAAVLPPGASSGEGFDAVAVPVSPSSSPQQVFLADSGGTSVAAALPPGASSGEGFGAAPRTTRFSRSVAAGPMGPPVSPLGGRVAKARSSTPTTRSKSRSPRTVVVVHDTAAPNTANAPSDPSVQMAPLPVRPSEPNIKYDTQPAV